MRLGIGEIIVIVFVIVVVFSASRMAALGNSLGKFIYSLRRAARGEDFVDANKRAFRPGASKKSAEEDAHLVDEPKRR